ncbi:MAG: DEAD/DEAH box helicase [Thermoproteota archaeon]|nr:DEAD/DEAH box helicase [Thermoproteota archaeon]
MHTIHPEAIDYLINVDGFSDFNGAQKDILNKDFIDYSSNYIVATNTGTGKTALAQLRIVDTLKKGQKVIFISPYKAIAEEKRQDFEYYNKYGWSCISSANPNETKDNIDYSKFNLISMTYEKFDSVLNNARFVNGWLKRVGLLVVDEAHMISDVERGPTLESSITKVITLFHKKIIILMLSAVLPNVESVASWINAKYGTSNWRPVDLEVGFALYGNNSKNDVHNNKSQSNSNLEKITKNELKPREILVKYGSLNAINKIIYTSNLRNKIVQEGKVITTENPWSKTEQITNPITTSTTSDAKKSNKNVNNTLAAASLNSIYKVLEHEQRVKDIDNPLWFLSEQTIKENGQVLIFTTDRASTESIASKMAFSMNNSKDFHKYLSTSDIKEIENNFIAKMKLKDDKLIAAMKNGVAFHHAGLDLQKRRLVEDAYKSGKIKILLSTTTLIAGVNLPATLVIFDSLSFWNGTSKQMMAKRDFLNGCGRAGRPGFETRGRALIMTSSLLSAIQFIAKPLEKVESQFTLDTLVFQTLSIIKRNTDIGQRYTTVNDINNFFKHSFYFSCGFKIDIHSYVKQLLEMDMITATYKASQNADVMDAHMTPVITNRDKITGDTDNCNIYIDKDNSNGTAYCITNLGYETIRFYLNPRTGYLVRNMLFALESYYSKTSFNSSDLFMRLSIPRKITILSFIHTLMHSKELQNLWKTTKLKDDEIEFVRNHSKEIMLNKTMYLEEKLTDDERKCLCTTMAFYDKLNMDDIAYRTRFEFLYQRFGRGDFAALQENMEWLVGATLRIAKVILVHDIKTLEAISNILITLSKRMNAGMVKEDLLELCSIREIGRIRSFILANAGIHSIKQLIDPNNKWIITNVLESEQLAERIIDNAKKNHRGQY